MWKGRAGEEMQVHGEGRGIGGVDTLTSDQGETWNAANSCFSTLGRTSSPPPLIPTQRGGAADIRLGGGSG